MKPGSILLAIALGVTSMAVANPVPEDSVNPEVRVVMDEMFDTRANCGEDRGDDDVCGGKKLRKQNSWSNCKKGDGKCCAKNADGSGGKDVQKGIGQEDCGYCFSGKCKKG